MGLFNSNGVSVTWCTLSEHCSARKDGMKLKLEYENSQVEERVPNNMIREGTTEKEKKLSFFESLRAGHERIGLVNIGKNESVEIGIDKNVTVVEFERVPDNLKWTDLFRALSTRRMGGACARDPDAAINGESNVSSIASLASPRQRREAYATIIHSSDDYVCGAVMLAHCLRNTGSTGNRDLVLLHDDSISRPKLQALAAAGWTLRRIERIHNPRAKRGAYNEYNFSKFRLWQLTEYDKIVFVDTDILILRSLDHLFRLPQISAVHDSGVLFNSGVMVIEPSNCTFNALVAHRDDIISYNGGDQGFLNEMFAWWHRLPKRLNHFKMAWKNATEEREWMGRLFAAETPELHGIHYFGVKPWRCYRDYDCNWDVERLRMYASDEFHRAWWRRYDEIDEGLRWLCGLTAERIDTLEAERRTAATMRFSDEHWKINITDKRRFVTVE
uniref:Hexosyltransferase n=1 Tax=Ananas comosus var. bracteatus TaxID=296719 RepID=A0A6V7Q4V2_ANACO|nr:unnamed protein product [Ananas comosus var. bracteatus]